MNEVASTNSNNLPSNITDMAAAFAVSGGTAGSAGGGEMYMSYTKFGEWVFGPEKIEVQEGSRWLINIADIQHGWIAWDSDNMSKGPSGELLVNNRQPMPSDADLPQVVGRWDRCIALSMRCMNGDDEGTQARWKSSSMGGRKEYAKFMAAMVARLDAVKRGQVEADFIYPLVELRADSYDNKSYGKIYTPVLKIVGWADMNGTQADDPARLAKEAEDKPARAKRPPAEARPAEPEAPAEEEAPRRRRRRTA